MNRYIVSITLMILIAFASKSNADGLSVSITSGPSPDPALLGLEIITGLSAKCDDVELQKEAAAGYCTVNWSVDKIQSRLSDNDAWADGSTGLDSPSFTPSSGNSEVTTMKTKCRQALQYKITVKCDMDVDDPDPDVDEPHSLSGTADVIVKGKVDPTLIVKINGTGKSGKEVIIKEDKDDTVTVTLVGGSPGVNYPVVVGKGSGDAFIEVAEPTVAVIAGPTGSFSRKLTGIRVGSFTITATCPIAKTGEDSGKVCVWQFALSYADLVNHLARRQRDGKSDKPNGCGPDGWLGALVPNDPNWGILNSFKVCCDEHDNGYSTCARLKETTDYTFLRCMVAVCDAAPGASSVMCKVRANTYYNAVSGLGESAYESAQMGNCLVKDCK